MKPRCRIWIENESGELLFGEGLEKLLTAISETGSISQAASMLNMSYKHAWGKIVKAESRLGKKIVHKHVGGAVGGGTSLTETGQKTLDTFTKFHEEMNEGLLQLFREFYPELK